MRPHESLHRLNIQDVGPKIQEAPTFEFDPATMFTEADWNLLDGIIVRLRQNGDWRTFARTVVNAAIIDPQRTNRFLRPDDWEEMKEQLEIYRPGRNTKHCFDFLELVSSMARINPTRAAGLVRDQDWERIAAMVNSERRLSPDMLARSFPHMYYLDPQRAQQYLKEEDRQGMMELLQIEPARGVYGNWYFFTLRASELAVFYPDSIRAMVSSKDWSQMVNYFLTIKGNVVNSLSMAAALTHLARVLKPQSTPSGQTVPFPEVKKY